MHRLRTARFLAQLVLGWFVLVVGLAVAGPLVQPQAFDMVCSGAGMKLVLADGGDDAQAAAGATLDCPLCAAVVPPPPMASLPMPQPLACALQPVPSAHIAASAAAALPARGPPSLVA